MASTLSEILGNRKAPNLAVEFRAEEIALFQLENGQWREIGLCRIDAPDLNDRAADMRRIASKRSGEKNPPVDIWLPREQIATLELGVTGNPRDAALEALTKSSAIAPDELVVDIARHGEGHVACATEKVVVEEARHYSRRWGFAPQRISTRHGHIAFAASPTFGRNRREAKPETFVGIAAALLLAIGLGWLLLGGPKTEPEGAPRTVAEMESAAPEPAPPVESAEAKAPAPPEDETASVAADAFDAPEPRTLTPPQAIARLAAPRDAIGARPSALTATRPEFTASEPDVAPSGEAPIAPIEAAPVAVSYAAPAAPTGLEPGDPPARPTDLGEAVRMAGLGDAPTAALPSAPSPETAQPDVAAPAEVAPDDAEVAESDDAGETAQAPDADGAPTDAVAATSASRFIGRTLPVPLPVSLITSR
ncbi:MAG: hypothetical protein AAFU55_08480 [Pseudomonadota bacterium]